MNEQQLTDLSQKAEAQLTETHRTYRTIKYQILDDIYSVFPQAKKMEDRMAIQDFATERQQALFKLVGEQVNSSVQLANHLQRMLEVEIG